MNKIKGFTLVELMIVVAIVGILASIAIPSYQKNILKSRRADARSALLGFANAMERHFTENFSYCEAATAVFVGCGNGNDTGVPVIFSATSPLDGTAVYYNLNIDAANATSFLLSATPVGPQANDDCGILEIDSLLQKDMTGAAAGMTTADCW